MRLIDATAGRINAHLFGAVHAPVKADGYDTEFVVTEGFASDRYLLLEIFGNHRANMMAARIYETDDYWFSGKASKFEGLSVRIAKCVVAQWLTDSGLAGCERCFAIVIIGKSCRHRRERENDGADHGGNTHVL